MNKPRMVAAALAALLALGLVAGCSGGASSLPVSDTAAGAPADSRSLPEAMPEEVPTVDPSRRIARSASLVITVAELAPAAESIRQVAASFGGMVVSENLVITASLDEGDDQVRSVPTQYSTIVLSVPADRLEAALEAVANVGEVANRTISAEDVTNQVIDVDARIATMRASISRLQDLMRRAGTLTEIAAIEAELTRRQADLESLLAQQKWLSQLVEQSTISVTLITRRQAEGISSGGFLSGLQAGWAAFLTAGRWLLTILGASLPFLIVAVIVLPPLLWWRRRYLRRRSHDAASTSKPTPTDAPTPSEPGPGESSMTEPEPTPAPEASVPEPPRESDRG